MINSVTNDHVAVLDRLPAPADGEKSSGTEGVLVHLWEEVEQELSARKVAETARLPEPAAALLPKTNPPQTAGMRKTKVRYSYD